MHAWSHDGGAVLVADGDPRFRQETRAVLAASGLEVREASSGEEALERIRAGGVALVLLDVRLGDISGYEVCRRLRDEHGDGLPILFASGERTEPFDRVAGLLVGADDYLVKPVAGDELVARVRRHLQRTSDGRRTRERLTSREREILELLVSGLSPTEIGRHLSISPRTVATHVEHIYAKLGVHTRAQAVASAFRLDLVD